jgi:hypothetical protein
METLRRKINWVLLYLNAINLAMECAENRLQTMKRTDIPEYYRLQQAERERFLQVLTFAEDRLKRAKSALKNELWNKDLTQCFSGLIPIALSMP